MDNYFQSSHLIEFMTYDRSKPYQRTLDCGKTHWNPHARGDVKIIRGKTRV